MFYKGIDARQHQMDSGLLFNENHSSRSDDSDADGMLIFLGFIKKKE